MRILYTTALLGLPLALLGQSFPVDADQLAELRREIASLKQSQETLQKDLAAVINTLNGRRPPLENVFIGLAGSPSLGQNDAKVTIVEFTDFQCPFCGAYVRETYQRIVHDYVDTGKARYVIRHFPLERVHPLARKAAEASFCANEQGKFWALHDRLFADQTKLASDDILAHASAIGANPVVFRECLERGNTLRRLQLISTTGKTCRSGQRRPSLSAIRIQLILHECGQSARLLDMYPMESFRRSSPKFGAFPNKEKERRSDAAGSGCRYSCWSGFGPKAVPLDFRDCGPSRCLCTDRPFVG